MPVPALGGSPILFLEIAVTEEEGRISTRIREIASVVRMVVRTQGEDASTVLHADMEWSGACQALEERINAALPSRWNAFAEEFRVLPPGDDPLCAPIRRCHVLVMRGCREVPPQGAESNDRDAAVPFTPSLFDDPEAVKALEASFSVDTLDVGAALDRSSLARISKKDFRRTIVREGGEPAVTFDDGTWSGSMQDARSRGSAANTEISEIRPARRIDEPANARKGREAQEPRRSFSGIEAIMRAYAPSFAALAAAVAGLAASAAMLLAFPLDASAAEGGNVLTMESLFSSPNSNGSADNREADEGYEYEAESGSEEGGGINPEAGMDGMRGAGGTGNAGGRRRASGNFMGLVLPASDFEDGGTPDAGESEMENGGFEKINGSDQGESEKGKEKEKGKGFPGRSASPDSEMDPGENVRAAGRSGGERGSRSASPNSGTDSSGSSSAGRGILREKPEESVSRDRVFHRPAIVFKRKDEAAAADGTPKAPPPEKFLFPSMSFLTRFDPWKFRIGDVVLLQDNYASLKRRHPDCRRIEAMDTESSGRIACRNTSLFQAEGSEVIFTYAKVNEILTGAAYAFSSRHRAEQFAQRIEGLMKASGIPSYDINPPGLTGEEARTTTAKLSRSVDTPMFIMTVQPSSTGWLVSVDAYFQARIPEAEAYAKAKISMIEFGTLRIGETTKADVLAMTDPSKASSKTCRNVSLVGGGSPAVRVVGENAARKTADSPSSGSDTQEFYGLCFDFPYEAHMQLDFDPATGILETAVLSPIGISSGGIVEDMLRARYGFPKYCRKTQSEVVLSEIKSDPRRGRARTKRMKDRPSSVFAGTCEEPIIYSADMRFIFENRNLGRAEIMAAYEERKSYVDAAAERLEAFDAKKEKVKGFFE